MTRFSIESGPSLDELKSALFLEGDEPTVVPFKIQEEPALEPNESPEDINEEPFHIRVLVQAVERDDNEMDHQDKWLWKIRGVVTDISPDCPFHLFSHGETSYRFEATFSTRFNTGQAEIHDA